MGKGIVKRPELNISISVGDFQGFYWLKTELASFCHANGISASGGKLEIAAKIEQYLATGEVVHSVKKSLPTSNFDWKNSELDLDTKLTDNYKNTENVRAFMTIQIGPHFRFNTQFMNWAKANTGKSLKEAIEEWNHMNICKKNKEHRSEIAPQFEYNRYIRDFMADNPGMTNKDAIKYWKIKRAQRGNNEYSKLDLN